MLSIVGGIVIAWLIINFLQTELGINIIIWMGRIAVLSMIACLLFVVAAVLFGGN